MLMQLSRWLDAVEKRKCDTAVTVPHDSTEVDAGHATRPQHLREGVSPPDLATIKDFLRFHVALSRGRIDDERTTVDSVNTFAEWYFAGFARVTGNLVNEEDRRAVYVVSVLRLGSKGSLTEWDSVSEHGIRLPRMAGS